MFSSSSDIRNCSFKRNFSSVDLDIGLTMVTHPVFCIPLSSLTFDISKMQFFHMEGGERRYFPRIGDGQDYRRNSEYPAHWDYDPFL